jgi:hypothetical protein
MTKFSEGQNPKLTPREALARFSVVSFIQASGVVITLGVLVLVQLIVGEGWQSFYWWLWGVAGVGSCLGLLLAFAIMGIRTFDVDYAERIIQVLFVTNTLAFALAMVRTGSFPCSAFGQVIPIQLSGILLLEQQKERMTSTRSNAALGYAGIAIVIWVIAELSRSYLATSLGWTAGGNGTAWESGNRIATTILVVTGMLFTTIAYLLPSRLLFTKFFNEKFIESVNT